MAIALGIAVAVAIIGRPAGPAEALAAYEDSWLVGVAAYVAVAVIVAACYSNKPVATA